MSLKLNTASGGSITLQEADTASNLTITVPANAGTMITTASTFAGTGPAFSAYASSAQTVSALTHTKVQINTETFDTNSNFNTSTYAFTPTVAGYYQVNCKVGFGSTSTITRVIVSLYKNGSVYNRLFDASATLDQAGGSDLVYLNGSTDYLELYGWINGAGTLSFNGGADFGSRFSASMVRTA
jgi:hypothetical protein